MLDELEMLCRTRLQKFRRAGRVRERGAQAPFLSW
jgi:hypothetical protein